jgi:hypothetical protein
MINAVFDDKREKPVKSATLKLLRIAISGFGLALLLVSSFNVLFMWPGPVYAVELQVCSSSCPFSTIQAAVDAAADGDVIQVAEGTYTDLDVRSAPPGYTGSAIISQVVYLNKSVTIQGGYPADFSTPPDPTAHPTVIDAQDKGRVIFIAGSISPVIEGFTLKNGNAAGLGGSSNSSTVTDAGGGVYLLNSSAALNDNQIIANEAVDGGGFYLSGSSAALRRNRISDNLADYGGGLFLFASPATLENNTIGQNRSIWEGGGVYLVDSGASLTANEIDHNEAGSYGGGVSLWQSPAILAGNILHHNVAMYIGGGLASAFSEITLVDNTIIENTSDYNCGGVALADSASRTKPKRLPAALLWN